MIDQKTIRKQKVKIAVFFITVGLLVLTLILSRFEPFMRFVDNLYFFIFREKLVYEPSPDLPPICGYQMSQREMKQLTWELGVVGAISGFFLICSIVFFIVFRIPKAFSILRKAKLQKKNYKESNEMTVSPEDLESHTLRPGEKGWTHVPQDEITKDLSSLFETTARIYDGKETTEGIPGESDDTNPGGFCILEDLYFLGSEERIC